MGTFPYRLNFDYLRQHERGSLDPFIYERFQPMAVFPRLGLNVSLGKLKFGA
jgi:hypothetical protein